MLPWIKSKTINLIWWMHIIINSHIHTLIEKLGVDEREWVWKGVKSTHVRVHKIYILGVYKLLFKLLLLSHRSIDRSICIRYSIKYVCTTAMEYNNQIDKHTHSHTHSNNTHFQTMTFPPFKCYYHYYYCYSKLTKN